MGPIGRNVWTPVPAACNLPALSAACGGRRHGRRGAVIEEPARSLAKAANVAAFMTFRCRFEATEPRVAVLRRGIVEDWTDSCHVISERRGTTPDGEFSDD